jgi:uroporphyrinogen decarboxylase
MTSKERLLITLKGGQADRVPVSPDISVMVPDRLAGRPFYDIHLDGLEHYGWTSATHGQVYVDAVRHFGFDGFYMYGGLKQIKPEGRPEFSSTVVDVPYGKLVQRHCHTELGDLNEEELYFADEPPWRQIKPVKDLAADFKKYKLVTGASDWQWESGFRDKHVIGEEGVYLGMAPLFQDWFFHIRQGGFEQMVVDYMTEPKLIEEIHAFWLQWALANVAAMLKAQADVIMLGGSSASMSVSSPTLFRKFELPFIQQASALCHAAGIVSHLHVCGRSLEVVEIVAEESDLTSIEPLEEPPSGNVIMKEVKQRFGKKLCLKGNLNTTDFMLHATPQQVEDRCKKLIDEAGDGGGFILSTGDQCGRDTPDANIFKMVEVAKTYGGY